MTIMASRRANAPRHVRGGTASSSAAPRFDRLPSDDRWPVIVDALAGLRADGRHSVRIVDADCGDGSLLRRIVLHARALGFTAVEGRGIDGVPALVARARQEVGELRDPAIGLTYEVADVAAALAGEAEFPADLVLWNGGRDPSKKIRDAVVAAGDVVVGYAVPARSDAA